MKSLAGAHGYTRDDLHRYLRARAIAPTRQRIEIAHVLFSQGTHLTAEHVLSLVNAGDQYTSRATVYNTLSLFVEKRLIRKVMAGPDRVFYDPNTTPHHHFYNVDTGEISDIDASHIAFAQLPELPQGMVSDGVDVVVRIRADDSASR